MSYAGVWGAVSSVHRHRGPRSAYFARRVPTLRAGHGPVSGFPLSCRHPGFRTTSLAFCWVLKHPQTAWKIIRNTHQLQVASTLDAHISCRCGPGPPGASAGRLSGCPALPPRHQHFPRPPSGPPLPTCCSSAPAPAASGHQRSPGPRSFRRSSAEVPGGAVARGARPPRP